MSKISLPASNDFCPQCLFFYVTYKENGDPNYGLFCWATYCSDDGFKFVACIGQDKLTRDRIRSTGVFSASIVSESLLPAADFCGNNEGYSVDKSSRIESVRGAVLNVPVPKNSPWSFELEVDKTLHLDDNNTSEIYICNIKNVLADESLAEGAGSFEERLQLAAPVVSVCSKYFGLNSKALGDWGQWKL